MSGVHRGPKTPTRVVLHHGGRKTAETPPPAHPGARGSSGETVPDWGRPPEAASSAGGGVWEEGQEAAGITQVQAPGLTPRIGPAAPGSTAHAARGDPAAWPRR